MVGLAETLLWNHREDLKAGTKLNHSLGRSSWKKHHLQTSSVGLVEGTLEFDAQTVAVIGAETDQTLVLAVVTATFVGRGIVAVEADAVDTVGPGAGSTPIDREMKAVPMAGILGQKDDAHQHTRRV